MVLRTIVASVMHNKDDSTTSDRAFATIKHGTLGNGASGGIQDLDGTAIQKREKIRRRLSRVVIGALNACESHLAQGARGRT